MFYDSWYGWGFLFSFFSGDKFADSFCAFEIGKKEGISEIQIADAILDCRRCDFHFFERFYFIHFYNVAFCQDSCDGGLGVVFY